MSKQVFHSFSRVGSRVGRSATCPYWPYCPLSWIAGPICPSEISAARPRRKACRISVAMRIWNAVAARFDIFCSRCRVEWVKLLTPFTCFAWKFFCSQPYLQYFGGKLGPYHLLYFINNISMYVPNIKKSSTLTIIKAQEKIAQNASNLSNLFHLIMVRLRQNIIW